MALINCKECGKSISSEAKTCPQCGAKCSKPISIIGIVVTLIFCVMVFQCNSPRESPSATPDTNKATKQKAELKNEVEFSENKSLTLKNGMLKVGMLADDFIKIVPVSAIVNQVVKPDPANPSSLLLRKDCKMDGKEFTVIVARTQDPGPYRIIAILTK